MVILYILSGLMVLFGVWGHNHDKKVCKSNPERCISDPLPPNQKQHERECSEIGDPEYFKDHCLP